MAKTRRMKTHVQNKTFDTPHHDPGMAREHRKAHTPLNTKSVTGGPRKPYATDIETDKGVRGRRHG